MSKNNDFVLNQIAQRAFFDPTRRAIAGYHKLKTFDDYCDAHGVTQYATKTGLCLKCSPPPPSGRPLKMDARSVARRDGRKWFTSVCEVHGATAHSVDKGKCLTCFTTTGAVRAPAAPRADSARARARQGHLAQYMDVCPTHGRVPHDTIRGKCLTCFTTLGTPRKRPPDNARAQARREGAASYFGTCEVHGAAAHSVTHGKCLMCFTSAGSPRKRLDVPVTRCDIGHALVGIAQHLERERGPDWAARRETLLTAAGMLARKTTEPTA